MCPSHWFLFSLCMFCLPVWLARFILGVCCTLYRSLQVYCIYCKRGRRRWSLTGLILFPLCFCVFLKSVTDSSRCKRREEQECFRLANCRSCSLNTNCQWEMQQQECQALPGEEAHPENEHAHSLSHTFWCITVGPYFRKKKHAQ